MLRYKRCHFTTMQYLLHPPVTLPIMPELWKEVIKARIHLARPYLEDIRNHRKKIVYPSGFSNVGNLWFIFKREKGLMIYCTKEYKPNGEIMETGRLFYLDNDLINKILKKYLLGFFSK